MLPVTKSEDSIAFIEAADQDNPSHQMGKYRFRYCIFSRGAFSAAFRRFFNPIVSWASYIILEVALKKNPVTDRRILRELIG